MDIAAAGFAATQIASAQRGQQAALSGIRAEQKQQQSVTNLLQQAVGAARQVSGSAPTAQQSAPAASGTPAGATVGAPSSGGVPSNGGGRGSLVNILA